MSLGIREATFNIDKYKKPVLLSEKESMVQLILNALFMVPGNLPSHPRAGVNILKYLYKPMSDAVSAEIEASLKITCGESLANTIVNSVVTQIVETEDGPAMVLLIRLNIDTEDDSDESKTLSVIIQQRESRVHFNYAFMNDKLRVTG